MLYELKDSSVHMKVFVLPRTLSHIVCHTFQITKNINGSIPTIQTIRNIEKKKRAIWDDPIEIIQL
jgi:hypothetical protein